jgi:hypothetical protein
MDATRKHIARRLLRLRVYQAKGQAYQSLFEKVMQWRDPDFVVIKPHGSIGDRKNDGYCPSTGTYYQVYAPWNPSSRNSEVTAARKAADDFESLREYWQEIHPVKNYRFVFNDEFRGSSPALEKALSRISNLHRVDARAFLTRNLEDEALLLDEDHLMEILNSPVPSVELLDSIDFSTLREVVNHIMTSRKAVTFTGLLNAPDFNEKIAFNGLSPSVATLLTHGSYQEEAVRDYFSRNSRFARQDLRNRLASSYIESRSKFESATLDSRQTADLVFFDLLETITPKNCPSVQKALAQEAAIILLAFYFEACDIFEDPDAATS